MDCNSDLLCLLVKRSTSEVMHNLKHVIAVPGENPLKSINPAKNEDIKDRVVQQIQLLT